MGQEDGIVRRYRADLVMGRITIVKAFWFHVPFFLVPTASDNPLTRRGNRGSRLNLLRDIIPGFCCGEIQHHLRLTGTYKMSVSFNETGDRQPPL